MLEIHPKIYIYIYVFWRIENAFDEPIDNATCQFIDNVFMKKNLYICVYICIYMYIYMYIYTQCLEDFPLFSFNRVGYPSYLHLWVPGSQEGPKEPGARNGWTVGSLGTSKKLPCGHKEGAQSHLSSSHRYIIRYYISWYVMLMSSFYIY